MSDLTPWLRATIEGDKETAEDIRASWSTTSWMEERPDGGGDEMFALGDERSHRELVIVNWASDQASEDELDHMARHDPEDTIARCEAELAEMARHHEGPCRDCVVCDEDYPCGYLRRHAYGYRHRTGYLAEWAPEQE